MKTGPRPLDPKVFAARHAEALNYTLVRVIEDRKFEVKCRACRLIRTISTFRIGSASCVCTHKRKHYRVKHTLETYNKHIQEKGYNEYECVKLNSDRKAKSEYTHKCGHKFLMSRDCFVGSSEPCARCRTYGYSNEDYLDIMQKYENIIVPLESYLQFGNRPYGMKHKYVKCGHVVRLSPAHFTRGRKAPLCSVCYPNRVWHKFKADGVRFQTRSKVELEFVRFLVREKNIDPKRIEYEPKQSKVSYFNPNKDRDAIYVPDFKIGNVYFEVKDLSSLGLRDYYWQSKEEALIENRAKCLAAEKRFDDYRVYVLIKGKFYRAKKFWIQSEQNRLLSI